MPEDSKSPQGSLKGNQPKCLVTNNCFLDAVNKLQLIAVIVFKDLEGDEEHHYLPYLVIIPIGKVCW